MSFRVIATSLFALSLLAGCASTPPDPRIAQLGQQLETFMANGELASRGGEALKRAEAEVRKMATTKMNAEELDEAVYSARRLLDVAEYSARAKLAEDMRKQLAQERERLVLAARTREAKEARSMAEQARAEAEAAMALRERALQEAEVAEQAKAEAEAARAAAAEQQRVAEEAAMLAVSEAEKAQLMAQAEAAKAEALRAEAEAAKAEMESMRSRLAELEARPTERGLLLTLGDVLFAFNKADLKSGVTRTLTPLVDVLKDKPEQMVVVEGHTDAIGSREYNLGLSERRAMAVMSFLVDEGIDQERISIEGLGPDYPVADNDTAEGRQQNRRVEVILPNVETR